MLYVPGTGMVFTAVITPNTCDYCCWFAATGADAGDGAWYWCCSTFTVAAAPPGAPAVALNCWSSTKNYIFMPVDFMSDEIVLQKSLHSTTYW